MNIQSYHQWLGRFFPPYPPYSINMKSTLAESNLLILNTIWISTEHSHCGLGQFLPEVDAEFQNGHGLVVNPAGDHLHNWDHNWDGFIISRKKRGVLAIPHPKNIQNCWCGTRAGLGFWNSTADHHGHSHSIRTSLKKVSVPKSPAWMMLNQRFLDHGSFFCDLPWLAHGRFEYSWSSNDLDLAKVMFV